MKRLNGRVVLLTMAGLLALLAGARAHASDIACHTPVGGPSARCEEPYSSGAGCEPRAGARKEHLICEYTMLSQRYERIYAEQQRMLRKGTLQAPTLPRGAPGGTPAIPCAAWTASSICSGASGMPCRSAGQAEHGPARCRRQPRRSEHEAASRPPAPSPAMVASRETPASAPGPAASALVASTAPDASAASKTSVAHAISAAPNASASTVREIVPDANAAAVPISMVTPHTYAKFRPAPLLAESLVSGLVVLGLGAGLVWNRRRAMPQAGGEAMDRRIPSVMKITYGLLFLNALLLPFTLGLR
ncbi:hypothetical protein AWV80_16290 [Cupriavidus sp. UYMU48A]|nr:hypothetical protein AWV80_16290 [Cupriavidus sp. UYMU48A]